MAQGIELTFGSLGLWYEGVIRSESIQSPSVVEDELRGSTDTQESCVFSSCVTLHKPRLHGEA